MKSNKGPILLKKNQIEDSKFFNSININEFQKRADILESATSFKQNIASMLLDIAEENQQEKELSGSQEDVMAEETLYTGGFPNNKDQKLKQQFREESWSNRYKLCQQFSDKRFSYFGLRLIYEECPEVLPVSVRDKIERSVTNQLTSLNKEKWKTCTDFDKEIEIIKNVIEKEEDSFLRTLDKGIIKLDEIISFYPVYILIRLIIIFPLYQLILFAVAFIFGEYTYFKKFFHKFFNYFKFR